MIDQVEDEIERFILRAREKCQLKEIDTELYEICQKLKAEGFTPVLCDGQGNKANAQSTTFTIRVGSLECTKP